MQHPDEGTIHAWLDGALSADEAALLEAHVNECPQCAAAVAEARGFIAAASRILTALDNAPRGVIPAAAPVRKRFDPMVWRIAASVLVIAGGTVLVLRSQGSSSREMAATAPAIETARPTVALDAAAESASASNSAASAPTSTSLSGRAPVPRAPESTVGRAQAPAPSAAKANAAMPSGAIAGERVDMGRRTAAPVVNSAPAAQKVAAPTAGIGAERVAAAPPLPAPATISGFLPGAGAAASLADAADRAVTTSEPLRVIGSPRRTGASVTVYEIAGDTITLTESKQVQLSSVIVTGAAETRARNQAAPATAAGPSKRVAASSVAADSQRTPPPPAVAPAPVATSLQTTAARSDSSSIRTITWVDPTTGNTISLSGRVSEARLQQLRLRIEKERAEAKKTP